MAEPYDPPEQARFYHSGTGTGKAAQLRASSTGEDGALPPLYPTRSGSRDELISPKSGPEPNKQKDKIASINREISQVKQQMEANILSISERGENLDRLQERSDHLTVQSKAFDRQASNTRRKMWFKNMKWTIILVLVGVLILVGVISGAVEAKKS